MSRKQSKRSDDSKETKLYEVLFHYVQYSTATEIIEATSLEEARRRAFAMLPQDIEDFDAVNGELDVVSVDPVKEGKSHD